MTSDPASTPGLAHASSESRDAIIRFDYQGATIRTATVNGAAWFVASDVAKALGYRMASDMTRLLDEDEKGTHQLRTPGGMQAMAVISEAGLYRVVLQRQAGYVNDPEARAGVKDFQRWVTHEVLPSIRARGGYLTPQAVERALSDPDFIIGLATSLKEERAARARAEQQIEADRPHTSLGRAVAVAEGDCLVKAVADVLTQNGIPMSQNQLFAWMRAHEWLCRGTGDMRNRPTKRALDRGWLRTSERVVRMPSGEERPVWTPRVTGAGQAELVTGFITGKYSLKEES
ncbi:phage antirepressor KilAC domain-containing protein [Actinomyces bowdenii]|uniref:phage antirepressor n=1 Tax=Actinomyces bowdenii TaxID=131109 RepID=UPI00214C2328|nr:phage antirepressor KilAC domain-containing protein [Actinomyces bowdenii]MCR2051995.1 phage antirepressor KilAC domain-containing protein [Actinomyces bowdenii]